ncbi:IclR family transcriptional regulator [Pseudarthrobacter sp. P1]|uniref:IclR family transcriptional regulator n=1 Tax=Pseudarthrobacter sp. P1 TaxID=3418418 RepID=UPI003CF9C987
MTVQRASTPEPPEEAEKPAAPAHSQTLSRGLRALEILAEADRPLTIAELSGTLGVHRSIAYRILRTLEDHSLVVRDDAGRLLPGPGLAVLARGVSRNLQSAALPELTRLSEELAMTAFVTVWDQLDCVTLVTVEPRHSGATLAQHPGTRHPVGVGAPGIAIQSTMGIQEWQRQVPSQPYRAEAIEARSLGYAASHDEVIAGLSSIAAPVLVPGQRPAAIAVVYIRANQEPAAIGAALAAAARRIEAELL